MTSLPNEALLQLELIGRCVLAALCGALIGLERKNRLKEAGLRTHLIVALGSALMMVVSKYGFFDVLRYAQSTGMVIKLDPSRVAASIVSGIGFLGAGTIFVRKQVINGLTTAAGLWSTAGIGMAIGAGMYAVGIVITLFQFVVQILLHKNLTLLHLPSSDYIIVRTENREDAVKRVTEACAEHGIEIQTVKFQKLSEKAAEVECFVKFPRGYTPLMAAEDFSAYDFVQSIET